jgi:hypothetical protein
MLPSGIRANTTMLHGKGLLTIGTGARRGFCCQIFKAPLPKAAGGITELKLKARKKKRLKILNLRRTRIMHGTATN